MGHETPMLSRPYPSYPHLIAIQVPVRSRSGLAVGELGVQLVELRKDKKDKKDKKNKDWTGQSCESLLAAGWWLMSQLFFSHELARGPWHVLEEAHFSPIHT